MTEEKKQPKNQTTEQQKTGKPQKEERPQSEVKKEPESKKAESLKPEKEVKVSAKLSKMIAEIEKLTVLELSDLVKALEVKFGVAAIVPVPATPAATQAEAKAKQAGAVSEQTIFNVVLAQTGPNKIQVIKALRGIKPTLGLQEAKKITEETPQEILTQVNKKEAEEAKKKLEEAGATVELK